LAKMWQPCARTASNASGGRSTSNLQLLLTPSLYPHTSSTRSTRWVEAVPLRNMEASMCTDTFITYWVACFGMPATVTTDRVPSSPLLCGQVPAQAWTSITCSPQLTALRAMRWLSACTGRSRMLYVHMVRVPRGTLILSGQLLHVPDPPRDDVPPPPTRPAYYAVVINTPPVHLAKADHVYLRVGGQQKPLVAPCDGPYPGGLQGGQDFHYPGGPKAGDRLRGPSEGPHQP
jgi:hypothetical protein